MVQARASAVWDQLWNKVSFLDGAVADVTQEFERRFIVGKFAVSIETVQNTSNPVEMTTSVGWASGAAYQE